MPLKDITTEVEWRDVHYVYIEKPGTYLEVNSQCWAEFEAAKPHISDDSLHFLTYFSMFKHGNVKGFCAGGTVAEAPTEELPAGVQYMMLEHGRYLQYTVSGDYSQLPDAYKTIMQRIEDGGIITRGGWYIEHYVNRHETTPEDELVTHILVPIP